LLATLEVVQIRVDLILGAIDIHRLHQLSFWDALVVKCAAAAGCSRLLTEDMLHGRILEGVRIENPFLD
jgi:predicted nucleic acid-binding protein